MKLTAKQKLQILKNVAVELPLEILQFLVVPIALLFCGKESEKLPRWAAWFDDPDYGSMAMTAGGMGISQTARIGRTLRAFVGCIAIA